MAYISQYKYYENEGVAPLDSNWDHINMSL